MVINLNKKLYNSENNKSQPELAKANKNAAERYGLTYVMIKLLLGVKLREKMR